MTGLPNRLQELSGSTELLVQGLLRRIQTDQVTIARA